MDSLEGSANDAMTAEIDRRVNKAVNYFINSCLNSRLQQVVATFYTAGASFLPQFKQTLAEADSADWVDKAKIAFLKGALSTYLKKGLMRDIYKCFNYNQISHITIWCPKPKYAYPAKVKKAKKREESSDKSPIEELGSSEAKESSGKE
ncbi:pol-like protein [Colletotrichum kahawae]|uniref:Pol-like protein n=1 Tax=Colletotrichum kahawae TaxID=34407 RepID=A0AAD9YC13_COLKA|nr:pol-like protein [Colletotrichum kahawae]